MKDEIKSHFRENEEAINSRLKSFKDLRESGEARKFQELVFVLLTSQSSAEKCWEATVELESENLLEHGDKDSIAKVLAEHGIQYEINKAGYIVDNREMLSQPTLSNPERSLKISDKIKKQDLESSREWFANNIKGFSWKGSSHFLRNIGYGDEFAILSNYTVKKLFELGYIEDAEQPKNKSEYLKMEESMRDLAEDLNLSMQELDLALWSMETGEVFK